MTFSYEVRKMMCHNHGGIILLLFVILSVLSTMTSRKPPNVKLELSKEGFLEYMSVLDGKLTDEKKDYYLKEGLRISEAEDEHSALYNSYYEGDMTEEELLARLEGINQMLDRRAAFELVTNQYSYILSDQENRYFLYTNGWDALMSENTLDVLLAAAVLLLITPVICGEYDSRMDMLIVVSSNGKKNWMHKILLSLITVATMCVFTYLLRYLYCMSRYGLPHPSYPLQSLQFFADSHKRISLLKGYLLICVMKLFGFLYFAAFILAVSTLTRKYSAALFVASGSVLAPYFSMSCHQYINIPLPFSFMMATSFFMGDEKSMNYGTGKSTLLYAEPTWTKMAVLIGTGAALSVICAAIVLHKHRNQHVKSRFGRLKGQKSVTVFAGMLMCAAMFSGCTAPEHNVRDTKTCYNLNSWYHVTEDYVVDSTEDSIMVTDKATKETVELDRDPINQFSGNKNVFMRGNCAYYIRNLGTLQICEVDLDTFRERVIFEKKLGNTVDFFGLSVPVVSAWKYFETCNGVFLDDDYFYFQFMDNTKVSLRRVDRKTYSVKEYEVPLVNAFFDGRYYYYLDDIGVLTRLDLHTDEKVEISTVASSSCYYYMDRLYYVNLRDKNYIYSCRSDGGDQRLEFEESCHHVNFGKDEAHPEGEMYAVRDSDGEKFYFLDN